GLRQSLGPEPRDGRPDLGDRGRGTVGRCRHLRFHLRRGGDLDPNRDAAAGGRPAVGSLILATGPLGRLTGLAYVSPRLFLRASALFSRLASRGLSSRTALRSNSSDPWGSMGSPASTAISTGSSHAGPMP